MFFQCLLSSIKIRFTFTRPGISPPLARWQKFNRCRRNSRVVWGTAVERENKRKPKEPRFALGNLRSIMIRFQISFGRPLNKELYLSNVDWNENEFHFTIWPDVPWHNLAAYTKGRANWDNTQETVIKNGHGEWSYEAHLDDFLPHTANLTPLRVRLIDVVAGN